MNGKVCCILFLTVTVAYLLFECFLIGPAGGVSEKFDGSDHFQFVDFVKGLFEDVVAATDYRYNLKDDQGCRLDTLKIVENPSGGYIGLYHFDLKGIFQVRLAISTDLLHWNFIRTVEVHASQPTIAQAPNGGYIVVFEKEDVGSHLKLHYYTNLSTLINGPPDFAIDIPRTLSNFHEGTPNVYNITLKDYAMNACIGFHYDDGTVDNVAVGWLTVQLDNSKKWTWHAVPQKEYNLKLRQGWNVKGNIGDRDYGQIFGRNFTLQEGCLVERDGHWAYWRIFLYDHLSDNFTMLNIKTHGGSTAFGNPTFAFVKSPRGKDCIVITYFLFTEGAASGESGELIFYKELTWEGRGIWVWASSFNSDPIVGRLQLHEAFKNFSDLNFNFILFLVKSSDGWLFYNSSTGPVHPNYTWDPLKVAVEEAHQLGLELHAWFCIFLDRKLAKERPDLAMVDANGNISTEWICPIKREVREYLEGLIREVASNYEVDGIHLDYIRYPNRNYCYCNECRENWLRQHPEIPWPPDPQNPTFMQFRQEQITSFIEEIRMMLKGINPKIKLSAAVLPIPDDAVNNRMQNYPEWAENGIIDFITPMTYTNKSQELEEWLKEIIKAVKGKTLIYAGIGLHRVIEAPDPLEEFKRQINVTRTIKVIVNCSALGVDGQALFRYKYLDPFYDIIGHLYNQTANTPHSEEIPPEIGTPHLDPLMVQPLQNVTIIVNVTDHPTRVRNVTLWYTTDNWTTKNFIWMVQTCQNTYQATIPGYKYCTWIEYRIEAYDIVGNREAEENKYHVIPEFPSNIILPLLMLTTLIATALLRRMGILRRSCSCI